MVSDFSHLHIYIIFACTFCVCVYMYKKYMLEIITRIFLLLFTLKLFILMYLNLNEFELLKIGCYGSHILLA